MKTFLLSKVKRLKKYSQELDAKAVLYDKSWEVFNETGDKELMIFRPTQELLISRNGILQKGKWELLDIANIIIDVGEVSYLLNASYIEDEFLALRLDGTERYMVMIEVDLKNRFSLNSIKSIEGYLDNRYKRIEAEKEAKKQEQKRLEERREEEKEKRKEEERKKLRLQQEERERQKRQKREKKEREERERKAKEEREKKIAEAEMLENQRKQEVIDNYRLDYPKRYKEIIINEKNKEVKKLFRDNSSWVRQENEVLIRYYFSVFAFILVVVTSTWVNDSEIIPLVAYIIGIPGVIVALIINFHAEIELIKDDIKPRNKVYAITFQLFVLLGVIYFAYSIYINYGDAYLSGTEFSISSQKFMIYVFICIAIKSIISIIANVSTIRHYYSLFSPDNDWLDTDDVYAAITNYIKQ